MISFKTSLGMSFSSRLAMLLPPWFWLISLKGSFRNVLKYSHRSDTNTLCTLNTLKSESLILRHRSWVISTMSWRSVSPSVVRSVCIISSTNFLKSDFNWSWESSGSISRILLILELAPNFSISLRIK